MNQERIRKYAELIVKKGANVEKGQVVIINIDIDLGYFAKMLCEECYKCGAKEVRFEWSNDQLTRLRYQYQDVADLGKVLHWEEEKLKWTVEEIPARIYITSSDPDSLKGIDQSKISQARKLSYPIIKPYRDALENKYQWVIAGVPSVAWAKAVFPSLSDEEAVEKLWEAILLTARVTEDPLKAWNEHNKNLQDHCDKLNSLHLKSLHYTASNGTDLTVGLMDEGIFLGGASKTIGKRDVVYNPNIPSEECFTTPKKGCAEGIVYSALPLSYNGEIIDNFSIRFENGKAVEVHAQKGESLLKEMISMDETAGYLGECALVPFDSPIRKSNILFLNTLYDENAACHLALGMGFTDCVKDFEKYSQDQLAEMGVNDSMIHVDFMIGTEDLNITGITRDGQEIAIFKDGNWAF
ncbi:MAG: aminopeptidase [Bacilli bacterium]|nr:aminopeptidase [Bacilli bacterium]